MALSASQSEAAIINVYTGVGAGELRADWEAAVGVFSEEDFSDGLWQDATINFIGAGHGSGITGGLLNDRLEPGNSTTFTFGSPIVAFGANWDLAGPGGQGLGIVIDAGGTLLSVEVPRTHAGQFFGFISDTPFTIVGLTSGTQGGVAETYNLDNAVYAAPEPATMLLLGLGAVGAVVRRRRR